MEEKNILGVELSENEEYSPETIEELTYGRGEENE